MFSSLVTRDAAVFTAPDRLDLRRAVTRRAASGRPKHAGVRRLDQRPVDRREPQRGCDASEEVAEVRRRCRGLAGSSRAKKAAMKVQALNIEDLRRIARRRLPRIAFDYLDGGVEDETWRIARTSWSC